MFRRHLRDYLGTALADTPAVLLNGARQTGKTTLARSFVDDARYFSLDDPAVLAAAQADPAGFVAGLDGRCVIDEVQKAPELLPVLKQAIDADRRPGRFLLTGSANVMTLPTAAESLAGRMEVVTLRPLSMGERLGCRDDFIHAVQGERLPRAPDDGVDAAEVICTGGFPEAVGRSPQRRSAWFDAYTSAILQRDIRDLSRIEGLAEMPALLRLLASRSGGLLNFADLSRSSGIAASTLKRYLALFEATFLYEPLPAWHRNLGKRLTRSPKIYLADSGLSAHSVGHDADRLRSDRALLGHLLEAFVVGELRKQRAWSQTPATLWHYRTAAGSEVDVVIENRQGHLVGVEVKARATVGPRDFSGLRALAESASEAFHRGTVLYLGDSVVPFAENLHAVPLPALWRWH